jgi:hypothetical protein
MGNGSGKLVELAFTVPKGKNRPMTTIVVKRKASNLSKKDKNRAGFITLEASITPAKSNSGFLKRNGRSTIPGLLA